MTAFDATAPQTWPLALTAEQVGAIYQRSPGGIKKACQRGFFAPVPFQVHPYRWRRSDVLRHVEGDRAVLRRSA